MTYNKSIKTRLKIVTHRERGDSSSLTTMFNVPDKREDTPG